MSGSGVFSGDSLNDSSMEVLNGTEPSNGSCSPYANEQFVAVAAVSACTALVSFLACVFVIVLIVLFKRYMFLTWRMVLYLTIAAGIRSIAIIFHRVDYNIQNDTTDSYCVFAGFFDLHASWSELMAVVCITSNLFINSVLNKRTDKLERIYIFLIFVFPITITWIPFIELAYGKAGAWCWIRSENKDCSSFAFGTALRFILWYIPLYVILIVLFVIWLAILCKVVRSKRKWAGKYDPQSERLKAQLEKEVKPLVWYPMIYILLNIIPFINRIHGVVRPDAPIAALWGLTAFFFPLQGGMIALAFTLNPATLKSLHWTQLRAAAAHWCYSREVEEYPLQISEDFRETEAVQVDHLRYEGFDIYYKKA